MSQLVAGGRRPALRICLQHPVGELEDRLGRLVAQEDRVVAQAGAVMSYLQSQGLVNRILHLANP